MSATLEAEPVAEYLSKAPELRSIVAPPLEAGSQGNASSQALLAAERENYLRLAADFENFRKRTARESGRRALEVRDAFIRDLLPVVDNLERAVARIPISRTALYQGVELTLNQLLRLLRQHGFEPELSWGQPFNPHRHEAMAVRTNPQISDNVVFEVWSRGWQRSEEIFRPAKVVVNSLRSSTSNADTI